MSVVTTTQRIAAMSRLISVTWQSGTILLKAFDTIPRTLLDNQLPCVIVLPGEASYDKDNTGDTQVLENRVYQLYVMIQNALLGTDNQGQIDLAPFFDAVRNYFMARPGLELDSATPPQDVVYDAQMEGDHGFELIPYPGGNVPGAKVYLGIVFDLRVKEWHTISYMD